MSTKPYSSDLISRVIEYIKLGNSQRSTSKIFKVSTSTISRWWLRYQVDGLVSPKKRQGSKGRINLVSLKSFVEANGDKTLIEIGKHFAVSGCSIYKRLKKLGFNYKKKLSPMWKLMKKKESNI